MSPGESSEKSGSIFLWLSVLVLGGMLFAAGVLVGHAMAPLQKECKCTALDKLDRRDSGPATNNPLERFTFPHALSGSDKQDRTKPSKKKESKSQHAVDENKLKDRQKQALNSLSDEPPATAKGQQKADGPEKTAPKYTIQVASFQQESQAQELARKLKASGLHDVTYVFGQVAGRGGYYRVRVGRFSSLHDAKEYMKEKKLKGLALKSD